MEASTTGSSSLASDLFIVLEPFRTGFADFVRALEPLSSSTDGPPLGSSDVYYRADTDIALLTIRLDRHGLTPQKLAWLTSVAARADLPVLDPSRLGFSDRRAFYEDYLPNYRVRVEARGGPQEALEELARLLALPDAPPLRPASSPSVRPAPITEDSARRTSKMPQRAPSGTEPNGRYGAARTVGQGAGARSASARRPTAGASSPAAKTSSPASTTAPPTPRPRALEYSALSRPKGRRRQGPALTSPESPRVHSPEVGELLPAQSTPGAHVPAKGAAVYPLARELSGQSSSPSQARSPVPSTAPMPTVAPPKEVVSTEPSVPGAPIHDTAPPGPVATGRTRPSALVGSSPSRDVRVTPNGARPLDAQPTPVGPGPDSLDVRDPRDAREREARDARPTPLGPGREERAAPAGTAPPGSTTVPPPLSTGARKRPALIIEDDEAPALQVRFMRGDHWASARVRALSLQGARLAAAAPPRLGDLVLVGLALDHLDVELSGEVTQVTTAAQAAGSGEPSGFSIHFAPLDGPLRAKLVSLLKRAKHSGISLRPPPPRASVRFPVRWPAGVITSWGELNTAALDVSRSGLFLASTSTTIGAREIIFHLPMDTTGRALSGRAQIAREVTEEMAAQRGLTRGYGVRIIDFTRNDAARYDSFLDRIRLRTEKRVMIAARRERATELGRGLIAAGYAVHSGNDATALNDSMNEAGPPPDAALIEAAMLASDPTAAALKRILQSKQVPCLTVGNEQPERARAVVDHLLQIT